MLSQQHTGHGHPATEGPGPSSGFMLTEEYAEARAAAFQLLRLGAGITKSADQCYQVSYASLTACSIHRTPKWRVVNVGGQHPGAHYPFVYVGYQHTVTCSRLGIRLRIPNIFDCSRGGRRRPVLSRPDHGKMRADWQCPRFQIVMARNGVQHATDVPFMEPDIRRLALEAAGQNLGIAQLMAVAVGAAIKKDLLDEILGAPPPASSAECGRHCEDVEVAPHLCQRSSSGFRQAVRPKPICWYDLDHRGRPPLSCATHRWRSLSAI